MGSGYFKIDRAIFESWIWKDCKEPYDRRSAWLYLIGMANFRKTKKIYKGQLQIVERGQLITSMKTLAAEWRWSINKVRRFLAILERDNMCTIVGTHDGTIITIENYAKYQDKRRANETASETASESPDETPVETHKKNDKECIKNDNNARAHARGPNSGSENDLSSLSKEELEDLIGSWEKEAAERNKRR